MGRDGGDHGGAGDTYENAMKLDPAQHHWMHAPETLTIMAALGDARFVGGAVRNALLGVAVEDVDIAVPLPPDQAKARMEAAGIKVVPTGIDHGTVTAIFGGKVFEITSLRRDIATDGRHAQVAYTDDWEQDAARRDFTMNALYASADGTVFDYAGGLEDLKAGRVRFVGDAAARIAEDYLRILRLFRFHAWYGMGELDRDALAAAAAGKQGLAQLSGERVAKELLRLLECPNPAPVLRLMSAAGILPLLLPFALDMPRLENLVRLDADNMFPADALLRLGALLPAGSADAAADKLKLSNAARVKDLGGSADIASHLSAKDVRRILYRLGKARFCDAVRLHWAGLTPEQLHGAGALSWKMLLKMAENWEQPRFPVTGRDVMAAGVPEGPQVGLVLGKLEDWWAAGDFAADEDALAEKLKSLIADGI